MTGPWRTPRTLLAAGVLAALFLFFEGPLRSEIWAIRQYQILLAPTVGRIVHCRFQPTCSQYALLVLQSDGFCKGNAMIAKRLLHCSPAGFIWDRLTQAATR